MKEDNLTIPRGMNILHTIFFVLSDRWTATGLFSAVVSFLLPTILLQATPSVFDGFSQIFKAIGILSSGAGVVISVLSVYRMWLNLKRDHMHYIRERDDFNYWKKEISKHIKSKDNA